MLLLRTGTVKIRDVLRVEILRVLFSVHPMTCAAPGVYSMLRLQSSNTSLSFAPVTVPFYISTRKFFSVRHHIIIICYYYRDSSLQLGVLFCSCAEEVVIKQLLCLIDRKTGEKKKTRFVKQVCTIVEASS